MNKIQTNRKNIKITADIRIIGNRLIVNIKSLS